MGWIAGHHGKRRGPRNAALPAFVEVLETRGLLATVTVHVVNFAFNPDPVTIHVGDTVHWVWDTDNHSTTSVAGSAESWDSGVHNSGFTFDHTFRQAGSFVYYCTIHGADNGNGTASGMAGTIKVVGAAAPVSITVMPANPGIAPGSTEQFMAMGNFSDGTTQDITTPGDLGLGQLRGRHDLQCPGIAGPGDRRVRGDLHDHRDSRRRRRFDPVERDRDPGPPIPPSIGRFRSSGLKLQLKVDKTYHGYVSYFSEPNTTPQDFHAAINWGDNSKPDPGHVHGRGNGHYAIIGDHRYVHPGVFNVTVTIRDVQAERSPLTAWFASSPESWPPPIPGSAS